MDFSLYGARVWDGVSPETGRRPGRISVERGIITSIEEGEPSSSSPQIRRLPAGSVVVPGLIDAHVHLDLDPTLMSPEDQLAVARPDRDLRMLARAREMVRAGITTARDLGAGEWRELSLRDAIARGELFGPRILCAGQPVTIPSGHCHIWGGVARDAAEQAAVIERQIEHGVDWIKVMATGGVFTKGSGIDRAQFDQAELRAMVELAGRTGRSVAAHCHGAKGIANAARAGIRTIEHCSFAGRDGFGSAFDPEVIEDVAQSRAWVSPTVNAGWARRIEKDGKSTRFHDRMTAVFSALRVAGVPLIASTDAGIPGVRHGDLPRALRVFAHFAGLSPLEVLRAATSESARALGLESVCGALRPGLAADLLVLEGDPLVDLEVLERPLLVIAAGRVAYDRSEESSSEAAGFAS
jgi:imidazolonepropionase-like amidohydrolase